MHEWMNEWMNEWMDGWMSEWKNDTQTKQQPLIDTPALYLLNCAIG